MLKDARGHAVTLSNPKALDAYERALYAFRSYRGDPIAPLDEALALDEGFAAAYATKALILAAFFERHLMRDALATLDRGRDALAFATTREQALAAAAHRIADGQWQGGLHTLEQILVEHPRDLVALQAAHLLDFYRGDALNLRNRISRVLPAWSAAVPGYAFVLGMHAFGYEECNQYPEAERTGRRAVELGGDDSWAVHAVGHVMEMQGRIGEGLGWYEQTRPVWDGADNGFAFHNAWHTALFHMDRGEHAKALEIFDARLAGGGAIALTRIDATALLWRLKLEGVDVAARFAAVADGWASVLEGERGFYAFNDYHMALAFAAAGRGNALARLREALPGAAGDNADMTRIVGQPVVEAALAYCDGRYDAAVEHLVAARDVASKSGGSHAQRDLLTLTLIDAATRAGMGTLARHYANERLVHKPEGAWGKRLVQRIGAREARLAA
jgi:tetratricopeptide (TPR) repeat protein